MVEPYEETCYYGPGLRFVSVLHIGTVQSQIRTKVTHVGLATNMKSEWSEFIFRPVPCKHMERNVCSVLTRILPWGVPGPPLLRNRGPVRTLGGQSYKKHAVRRT